MVSGWLSRPACKNRRFVDAGINRDEEMVVFKVESLTTDFLKTVEEGIRVERFDERIGYSSVLLALAVAGRLDGMVDVLVDASSNGRCPRELYKFMVFRAYVFSFG